VLGYLTQKGLIRKYGREVFQRDLKMRFPMISTLGVLGIVFVAMALKAESILAQPEALLLYLFPLAFLYLINFALSTVLGKLFFSRGEGIALVYGTVMRNLSIALAIAMTVFKEAGAEIAIIIALAYIVQVQAAAWYVRFSDRIFGIAPAG
jgi:ACR3 family arsenite transporter